MRLISQCLIQEGGNTPETYYYPWTAPHALRNSSVGMSSLCMICIWNTLKGTDTNFQSVWRSGRGVDTAEEGVRIPRNIFLPVFCLAFHVKCFHPERKDISGKPQIMRIFGATMRYHLLSPQKWAPWADWNHLYFSQTTWGFKFIHFEAPQNYSVDVSGVLSSSEHIGSLRFTWFSLVVSKSGVRSLGIIFWSVI